MFIKSAVDKVTTLVVICFINYFREGKKQSMKTVEVLKL